MAVRTGADGRHILLIHQLFLTADQAGGTRHYELARHWLGRGARVTVVAGGRSYLTGASHAQDGELPDGLSVRRVGTLPIGRGGFVARLANFVAFTLSALFAALRVRDVDVVVGTTPPIFQAGAAAAAARIRGIPFVLEVRDLWPDFAIGLGVLRNSWLIAVARGFERWLYRTADQVVVNSPGFVDHVERVVGKAPAVVPNGVDSNAFDPASAGSAFRAQHDLQERFLVVYAGAHGIPNDLGCVLDAAERLGDETVYWVLVGDGREKRRLVADAERRGLSQVVFLPPVTKRAMPDVLAAADLTLAVLAPLELFQTVYPNKVFDYMAAGRPVVLNIDGAARDVVETAGGGCFVPPGDPGALAEAVRRYRADPQLGRQQGAAGRAFVAEHFRREDHALTFLDLLEGTIEGRR